MVSSLPAARRGSQSSINMRRPFCPLLSAVSDLNLAAGGDVANSDSKVDILMARSRNPSLSLHGIAGAFSGAGAKTVIPATVSGKFSLRYVVFCHTGTSM